jgi:uncharacterized repeat protein (TIGR01451 family)
MNSVILNYDDANGNPQTEESDSVDITVTAPDMTITKISNVTEADPGDQITYTIEYENTGTGDATDVVIVDTIDSDTTYASATPTPSSIVDDVITWNIGTVIGGGSGSITLVVEVDAYVADGTTLTNTVTLNYDDTNGNPQTEESDSVDVTVTAPDMIFSKSSNDISADPGDTIVYTLFYENTGSGVATGVTVVETLPEHVTLVSYNPNYDEESGNTYTWNIGTVAGYSSGTITITVTVNPGTPDGTLLINMATLDYYDANGNPYDQLVDYSNVTVTAPVMCFSKTADTTLADPGDTLAYTLVYYNSGSGVATDVVVTDTIPNSTTFVGSSPNNDDVSGNTYTWNTGFLGAYSGGTITITVTVDPGTPDGTLLRNMATLDYDDANDNPYEQMEDHADVTVTAPILNITKTSDVSEADPGDEITYTIEFMNLGEGNATNVWINDTIPSYTTLMSFTPAPYFNFGDTYGWYYSLIGSNSSVTITIVVEVDVGTPDQTVLYNHVTLDYSDDNGNPLPQESALADVTVTAPVLHIIKTANTSTADPGDTIIYTIHYWNTGSGWATLVEIVDTISSHTTFGNSSPSYDSVNIDEYTWLVGDVAPGANLTITIIVTVDIKTPDKTLLHNTVTLDYADANGNYYTQLDDYADVIVTAPVMTITKTADVSTADPGDPIVYTITYKNTGSGWASLVSIVDTLPEHVTLGNSSPMYDSAIGNKYTWDLGDVAPGTTETITIWVTVDVGTDDRTLLHNTVTLDYADANGNYYPQQDDYADVIVTAPVMSISKEADVSEADPGDTVIYTIQYENTGTGDATDVTIVDTLPTDVTFVSSITLPDVAVGNTLTWNIGDVPSGTSGTIMITVTVNVGTPDETQLINDVTLDYSDANGNFIEQLTDSAVVTVTAPIMTLSKEAGQVTILEYVLANFTIRIAGEKWHDVRLTLFYDGVGTDVASVTRFPGDPDDQSVTIYDVKVGVIPGTFSAAITYTPWDDEINGQFWGADPCWLIITFPDGASKRLHHTFNVRHNDTWIWEIDDFTPYIAGQPIIHEAIVPYTITYENIGTGDASNVMITDILPENVTLQESDPLYDINIGNMYTWYIGDVESEVMGQISIVVGYIFEDNSTILTNEVTLDYSDANGNYIELLTDSVDVILVMSIEAKVAHGISGGNEIDEGASSGSQAVSLPENPEHQSKSIGGSLMFSSSIPESQYGSDESTENENTGLSVELPVIEWIEAIKPDNEMILVISAESYSVDSIYIDTDVIVRSTSIQTLASELPMDNKENPQNNHYLTVKDDSKPQLNLDSSCESGYVGRAHEEIDEVKAAVNAPAEVEDEVTLGDYSVTLEKVHQPQSNQGLVTSSDIRIQEITVTPSAGLASVSVFLTLAALLFALCALAVGAYNRKKPQIVKGS